MCPQYVDKRLPLGQPLEIKLIPALLLLFGDNKVKMARKPLKKQKKNPVGCTGKGKR